MPRILLLTRYDRTGASSRVRMLQYVPYLSAAGFDVEVGNFFDADYLTKLYQGRRSAISTGQYFRRRIGQMLLRRSADIVWVEKEALPWVPWLLEALFYKAGIPLVSDYDDAVFHRYDLHSRRVVRLLLSHKIDGVMRRSDLVIAGNGYLSSRADRAGARKVIQVPSVVDMRDYSWKPTNHADGRARVGWIGTPDTWSVFGKSTFEILRPMLADTGTVFRAVGAGLVDASEPHIEHFAWSEEREVALIQGMDIGVMPLPDTPWTRGKCAYKLVQYMACGLPVVASPVGMNSEVVEHGVTGFLAETEADWRHALLTLLKDPALRHRMGQAGRKRFETAYSLQVHGPRVAKLLSDLAGGRGSTV